MRDRVDKGSSGANENLGESDAREELRDPRFAELDAQIKTEVANRQGRSGVVGKPKRRRSGPRLPAVVRKEITRCLRQLRQHRKLFTADPRLKDRTARFLRSILPPKRRRGRPGLGSVTVAIQLLNRFKRQHPEEKPEQIWKRIYPEAISKY